MSPSPSDETLPLGLHAPSSLSELVARQSFREGTETSFSTSEHHEEYRSVETHSEQVVHSSNAYSVSTQSSIHAGFGEAPANATVTPLSLPPATPLSAVVSGVQGVGVPVGSGAKHPGDVLADFLEETNPVNISIDNDFKMPTNIAVEGYEVTSSAATLGTGDAIDVQAVAHITTAAAASSTSLATISSTATAATVATAVTAATTISEEDTVSESGPPSYFTSVRTGLAIAHEDLHTHEMSATDSLAIASPTIATPGGEGNGTGYIYVDHADAVKTPSPPVTRNVLASIGGATSLQASTQASLQEAASFDRRAELADAAYSYATSNMLLGVDEQARNFEIYTLPVAPMVYDGDDAFEAAQEPTVSMQVANTDLTLPASHAVTTADSAEDVVPWGFRSQISNTTTTQDTALTEAAATVTSAVSETMEASVTGAEQSLYGFGIATVATPGITVNLTESTEDAARNVVNSESSTFSSIVSAAADGARQQFGLASVAVVSSGPVESAAVSVVASGRDFVDVSSSETLETSTTAVQESSHAVETSTVTAITDTATSVIGEVGKRITGALESPIPPLSVAVEAALFDHETSTVEATHIEATQSTTEVSVVDDVHVSLGSFDYPDLTIYPSSATSTSGTTWGSVSHSGTVDSATSTHVTSGSKQITETASAADVITIDASSTDVSRYNVSIGAHRTTATDTVHAAIEGAKQQLLSVVDVFGSRTDVTEATSTASSGLKTTVVESAGASAVHTSTASASTGETVQQQTTEERETAVGISVGGVQVDISRTNGISSSTTTSVTTTTSATSSSHLESSSTSSSSTTIHRSAGTDSSVVTAESSTIIDSNATTTTSGVKSASRVMDEQDTTVSRHTNETVVAETKTVTEAAESDSSSLEQRMSSGLATQEIRTGTISVEHSDVVGASNSTTSLEFTSGLEAIVVDYTQQPRVIANGSARGAADAVSRSSDASHIEFTTSSSTVTDSTRTGVVVLGTESSRVGTLAAGSESRVADVGSEWHIVDTTDAADVVYSGRDIRIEERTTDSGVTGVKNEESTSYSDTARVTYGGVKETVTSGIETTEATTTTTGRTASGITKNVRFTPSTPGSPQGVPELRTERIQVVTSGTSSGTSVSTDITQESTQGTTSTVKETNGVALSRGVQESAVSESRIAEASNSTSAISSTVKETVHAAIDGAKQQVSFLIPSKTTVGQEETHVGTVKETHSETDTIEESRAQIGIKESHTSGSGDELRVVSNAGLPVKEVRVESSAETHDSGVSAVRQEQTTMHQEVSSEHREQAAIASRTISGTSSSTRIAVSESLGNGRLPVQTPHIPPITGIIESSTHTESSIHTEATVAATDSTKTVIGSSGSKSVLTPGPTTAPQQPIVPPAAQTVDIPPSEHIKWTARDTESATAGRSVKSTYEHAVASSRGEHAVEVHRTIDNEHAAVSEVLEVDETTKVIPAPQPVLRIFEDHPSGVKQDEEALDTSKVTATYDERASTTVVSSGKEETISKHSSALTHGVRQIYSCDESQHHATTAISSHSRSSVGCRCSHGVDTMVKPPKTTPTPPLVKFTVNIDSDVSCARAVVLAIVNDDICVGSGLDIVAWKTVEIPVGSFSDTFEFSGEFGIAVYKGHSTYTARGVNRLGTFTRITNRRSTVIINNPEYISGSPSTRMSLRNDTDEPLDVAIGLLNCGRGFEPILRHRELPCDEDLSISFRSLSLQMFFVHPGTTECSFETGQFGSVPFSSFTSSKHAKKVVNVNLSEKSGKFRATVQ